MNGAVVFLLIFIVATGAIAIITSLSRTFDTTPRKAPAGDDSSLEAAWFKLRAPIGFVYGLIAIGGVIFYIDHRSDVRANAQVKDLTVKLASSEARVAKLQSELQRAGIAVDFASKIDVPLDGTASLLGGNVLIVSEVSWKLDNLEFRGSDGWAEADSGPFKKEPRPVKKGDRFFIQVGGEAKYAVNILERGPSGWSIEVVGLSKLKSP